MLFERQRAERVGRPPRFQGDRPTNDIAAAGEFYGHVLGYQEPFSLDKPSGGLMLTYFNSRSTIANTSKSSPELRSETEDRLSHIAFETTNIQQLRDYLASKGVRCPTRCPRGAMAISA
jgi:lactoylglutathione lyase